jgi:hypothetical protein
MVVVVEESQGGHQIYLVPVITIQLWTDGKRSPSVDWTNDIRIVEVLALRRLGVLLISSSSWLINFYKVCIGWKECLKYVHGTPISGTNFRLIHMVEESDSIYFSL